MWLYKIVCIYDDDDDNDDEYEYDGDSDDKYQYQYDGGDEWLCANLESCCYDLQVPFSSIYDNDDGHRWWWWWWWW